MLMGIARRNKYCHERIYFSRGGSPAGIHDFCRYRRNGNPISLVLTPRDKTGAIR
jgi:hypothetical protein